MTWTAFAILAMFYINDGHLGPRIVNATFSGPLKEGHLGPGVSDAKRFYHRGQMRLRGNGKCIPSSKMQMQKYRSTEAKLL